MFNIGGGTALLVGLVGAFLPLLPTVPFLLLAAFCFARGNPRAERWLVDHPQFGPHIIAWRTHGAISPRGKRAALVALAISAAIGLATLPLPWSLIPLGVALICGTWIATRPSI